MNAMNRKPSWDEIGFAAFATSIFLVILAFFVAVITLSFHAYTHGVVDDKLTTWALANGIVLSACAVLIFCDSKYVYSLVVTFLFVWTIFGEIWFTKCHYTQHATFCKEIRAILVLYYVGMAFSVLSGCIQFCVAMETIASADESTPITRTTNATATVTVSV